MGKTQGDDLKIAANAIIFPGFGFIITDFGRFVTST